ncbi:glycoside hydrolase family 2 TIM barrel-domain containing protein [uncultured Microbacterium sp.]|uniref:glycoside hydrolase family 2 TIM barrel-domain containing protein n=1 Tax=uncultured Microbacterium sp. TaxID=191216 RepID=UPI0026302DBF|nr:glycoside hydrolase family 2 TIM barrel-domain containing protein [uncultured Microbacterium sp.]
MRFDVSRIADPRYVSEGRLGAHSDHRWFRDAGEADAGASGYEQSLNGRWKIHYANNAGATIPGFEAVDVDVSGWDDIPVPAHIQLHGYDRPQYVNVQYPWDGREQIEPGEVPERFNPVASYVKTFTLDRPLEAGERLSVTFHGVESAIALWLNGRYIGYATDSFTPSEFDLTDALQDGENRLAAQVFKWTAASWIEDQDFYRFSGIFRDVTLYRRPAAHVEDLVVRAVPDGDYSGAEITVATELVGDGTVSVRLEGVGALDDRGDGTFGIRIDAPRLWSPESPALYDLTVEVTDAAGSLVEVIPQRVGIRRFAIDDGVLSLNGVRVVFNGVNRHEFGLNGRVVSREQTDADLRALKQVGVNAVRTSHYPNSSAFYELADTYGLMVIDEMNLESHGLWDRIRELDRPVDESVPGDKPEWLPALQDRAASMFHRDRNHPSIVIWSLGNESFGGTNLRDVADWFRGVDDRPVHYEGVHWDPRYPETTDITSQMYTTAANVEAYLAENRDKPFILCEYAHAMGNSFGAVDEYIELAYREPLFQGGFIWDFADQAIELTDRYGQTFLGYGGDCGESPHDGDFCGNGIFFADHSPTPKLQEVAYLYQGMRIRIGATSFEVDNRLLTTSTSAYRCVVTLAREGVVLREDVVETDVAAQTTGEVALPFGAPTGAGEYTVDVTFRLPAATSWGPEGHRVAGEQTVWTVDGPPAVITRAPAPELIRGTHNIGVRGDGFSTLFSTLYGGLASYRFGQSVDGGRELLASMPKPNFWHAPTANERGWGGPFEDGQWLLASRYARVQNPMTSTRVRQDDESVTVSYRYELPTQPATAVEVDYRVDGAGRVEVTQTLRLVPGLPELPEFGMLLAVDADFHRLRVYGEGPEESYIDRRGGARLDVYERDVRTELTPYLRPQEAGSRTGVRWAEVTDRRGVGVRVDCAGGMEFSALPWTPFEIENAEHHTELPPIHRTVLRPALMRRGVGGDDSWGARTLPEYRLPRSGELVFRFSFQGI